MIDAASRQMSKFARQASSARLRPLLRCLGQLSMRSDAHLQNVMDAVYEAAIDARHWPTALTQLARATRADAASIVVQDRATQTFWDTVVGSQAVIARAYDSCAPANPLWPATLSAPRGSVLADPVRAARDAYERSREGCHPSSCTALTLTSVVALKVLHDPVTSGVSMFVRGPFTAPFDYADVSFLMSLAPHLQRALQVNQRVARLEGERAGLMDALEHASHGVLILDSRARILFANSAAQTILGEGDGLQARPDGLYAGPHTQTLRRLLAGSWQETGDESAGFMALKRPAPRRPLMVLVKPLRRTIDWIMSPAARSLLFVADPDTLPAISAEQLRRLYGLTPAEGEVAVAVLDGEGVRGIAESLGVSVATARTHLHRIFEKTGTRRQAELVRLVLNSRLLAKTDSCEGQAGQIGRIPQL
jgi:DNA-binding CsgD family transcriptional regulator/PAS domain-containing protein